MSQAETISDPALRQMFLANIPHHREILALWARKQAESQNGAKGPFGNS